MGEFKHAPGQHGHGERGWDGHLQCSCLATCSQEQYRISQQHRIQTPSLQFFQDWNLENNCKMQLQSSISSVSGQDPAGHEQMPAEQLHASNIHGPRPHDHALRAI